MAAYYEDDAMYDDDAFLEAVASVESQHLGRLKNVLSYDGGLQTGLQSTGAALDNNRRRGPHWEEAGVDRHSDQQQWRPENPLSGDYSVQGNPKKRRTTEDMAKSHGQEGGASEGATKPEGEYMAALRGSNSELWQSSTVGRGAGGLPKRGGISANAAASVGSFRAGGSGTGTCYKCGSEGHWAKDCTATRPVGSPSKPFGRDSQAAPNVPERLCACGAGVCIVLTANTERNPGRPFYRCPLRKDDGQCSFFEWCDAAGQIVPTERGNFQDSSQLPQLQCKCGGGPCAVRTAKTEKNMGRQFFKCPLPQGESCSFFQWSDEVGKDCSENYSSTPSRTANYPGNNMGITPIRTSNYPGNGGTPAPATGSYFKSGQDGHWSQDCPNQQPQSFNANRVTAVKSSGSCFKCGGQGHWSNSCPNSGTQAAGQNFARPANGGSVSGGSCYKCGDPGHWANRCPTTPGGQR